MKIKNISIIQQKGGVGKTTKRSTMNRTVLITGSTRRIGLQTAVEFLKNGDQVVIFSRKKERVEEARKNLPPLGKKEALLNLVIGAF
jgi:NAD(P)-dependent dehydrogenase (short-subunit alcohol dehydrogenase family)